jgi:hypothetical protein
MQSPLVLENNGGRVGYWGVFLCAPLFVFVLSCIAFGQVPVINTTNATRDFYPRALDVQLRRIVESPADEVQPLRQLCMLLLHDLNAIVIHLEHRPAEPCPELERLEESIKTLEVLRASWMVMTSVDEPYIPSVTALGEIVLALQRRVFIWQALLKAERAEASPVSTLYGKNFADLDRLKDRTLAVEHYFTRSPRRTANYQAGQTWRDYLETQSWLTELEAYRQPATHSVRLVSLPAPSISVEILRTLSDRANMTIHRLEAPTLTDEQRTFLNHSTVTEWKEELQRWRADLVVPLHGLRLLEQYEMTGGMSDMRLLSQFIDQLSISKTAEYRQLGSNLHRQYGRANIGIFLSNALLNNHLPPPISEIASFRDVIQSQPTVGRRQTESELVVSFVPHPTRILTSLDVTVDLAMVSRSDAFATQLFNTGRALIVARKPIELTEKGFLTEPCEAQIVAHQMNLVRMDTGFDGLPVISGLFREAVRNQYASRAQGARTESQRKMLHQVRRQIDRETEKRLQPINENINMLSQYMNEEFGLRVEKRDSRTDENWLLTAWGIRGRDTLTSSTPAPDTLPGSFADLKIHESLPNMLLSTLGFEGKRGRVAEFKEMLAEKFRQPDLAAPEENDHVEITFAPHNPLVVRFVDGRVELTISIAALRLLGKTHRNFQVIVRYKPAYNSEGRLVLERDSYISLINVRERFVMLAAFGKIFPVSRPFPLVPNILDNDPQFDYLTTGHCRIERGWFALALVELPETATEETALRSDSATHSVH